MKPRRKTSRKSWAMAPGMTPALAGRFERGMTRGDTVKHLTSPDRKTYVVPASRYKVHCGMHPAWARRIAKLNKKNISIKKRDGSDRRALTQEYCLKGLHRMTGRM
ncbi:hypothetical protein [Bradyrhizobium sp. 164]|uniref:hypothetical protein n=1 Tax=Bradyrhizobium sp. 164 TaxID=2782637 RepID=UPI001FF85724|nr:hypothetical protein [Bradyrhizobium sp. 164]MCK1599839.1 hypothetical protein [Bradyrhizobium sp. 164]